MYRLELKSIVKTKKVSKQVYTAGNWNISSTGKSVLFRNKNEKTYVKSLLNRSLRSESKITETIKRYLTIIAGAHIY